MQVPGDVFLMWWHGCKNNDAREKKNNIMSSIYGLDHFFQNPLYVPNYDFFFTQVLTCTPPIPHPPTQPTNRSLTHSPTHPPIHSVSQSFGPSFLPAFLPSFLPSLLPSFISSIPFNSILFPSLPCLKASVCRDMHSMHSHKWSQRQITYRHVQS